MKKVLKILIFIIPFMVLELSADIGKVVALRGDGEIIREKNTIPLKLGLAVERNDIIKTKNNGRTQIIFNDETIITIGKNSNFKIDSYIFDDKENSKLDFKFTKGLFKVISGQIGKLNPDVFKLKTKTASIGIRGTQINMSLNDSKEFIKCAQGAIDVTLLASGETRLLKSGESILVNIKDVISSKKSSKDTQNYSSSKISVPSSSHVDTTNDDLENTIDDTYTAVNDAFTKGNIQNYETKYITGTIDEKNNGWTSFDTTNATFEMSIDFGKARDDNPVTVETFEIITNGNNTNSIKNIVGNINSDNEIELSYKTNESGAIDVSNNMTFKNSDLDVEGKDLEFKTYSQHETVIIKEIQLEAK